MSLFFISHGWIPSDRPHTFHIFKAGVSKIELTDIWRNTLHELEQPQWIFPRLHCKHEYVRCLEWRHDPPLTTRSRAAGNMGMSVCSLRKVRVQTLKLWLGLISWVNVQWLVWPQLSVMGTLHCWVICCLCNYSHLLMPHDNIPC